MSRAEMFASSTNIRTNSACPDRRGWIRLTTNGRPNAAGPSPTARNTSAIPPLPIFSVSRYFMERGQWRRTRRTLIARTARPAKWASLDPLQRVDDVLMHDQTFRASRGHRTLELGLEFGERHRQRGRVDDDDHREIVRHQRLRDVDDVAAGVGDRLGDARDDPALVLARRRHHGPTSTCACSARFARRRRRPSAALGARGHLARHLGDDAAQIHVLHRGISTRSTTATTAASIGTDGLLPGASFSLTATRAACPNATITSSPGPASSVSAQTTRSSVGSDAVEPSVGAAPGARSPTRYGRTSSSFSPCAEGHFTVDQTVPATRPRNI